MDEFNNHGTIKKPLQFTGKQILFKIIRHEGAYQEKVHEMQS